ncbi:interleukin-1 receptor-associated kinase-like 2 isoform X2 [Cavia porcellus]|nr:interleukin-1 receptor-associated kinase-like 2 isoform X2 [Cavia porcellus]
MERVQGVSITRELLWWWGMRQATVQQLLDLLGHLELHRAAHIVRSWKQGPETSSSLPAFPGPVPPGSAAAFLRSSEEDQDVGKPLEPAACQGRGGALPRARQLASVLLLSEEDTACPIKTDSPATLHSKNFSTSVPKQARPLSCSGASLLWSEADVIQATSNFHPSHRISSSTFADVYRGQRHGVPLVVKQLRVVGEGASPGTVAGHKGPGLWHRCLSPQAACSASVSLERFLRAEVQVCLRCCHANVLPLLGFCTGGQCHSLIYPYMANGSLQDRLQGQDSSDPLPWTQLVSICSGLLCAVEHLHGLDIIHGNVKSSNILLDEEFTPKLAHPVVQLCSVDKRSEYTVMKTHLFQASAAYVPEDFIRVGQLTKRVDIFSCGIVLAEVLTGMPAMDSDRSPVYLKDLLLSEIPSSRKPGVQKVMAKEICQKYLKKRGGSLPEDCTEALATAVYHCLWRRNSSLWEARSSVVAVEERLRAPGALLQWSGLSAGAGCPANTPVETGDVDFAGLQAAVSATAANSAAPETSWKIEINEAKRKLMENILLYKEEKLDSIELFGP